MKRKRYSGENVAGPSHSSPYPTQRLAAPISLVDTAQQIEAASETVAQATNARLQQIVRQIQQLQEEARAVLERTQRDLELHQAECRFQRVPGKIYHLYRSKGHLRFSLLSPQDYNGRPPHEFVGSYRLERDQSWTPLTEVDARDREHAELSQTLERALSTKPQLKS